MVDLENNNLSISLLAEENISSALINENLQVVFDTSANISVTPALSYIKSGQKEISDYVSDVAEPRLSEYAQTAQNQMQNCVDTVQKFADDIVDKGFVKTVDLQNVLEGKQDVISDLPAIRNGATLGATAVQPSALNGYATQAWVGQQGYITGITSSDVTTALGYTPYNASNPSGYITSSALTPYALSADLASVATSGSYNDLLNKPDLSAKADVDLSNINTTGKSFASGLGMPSSRYMGLTLGASGTTYTAPANGWFLLYMHTTTSGSNNWAQLINDSKNNFVSRISADISNDFSIYLPVNKGDIVLLQYKNIDLSNSWNKFRFYYAEGENV